MSEHGEKSQEMLENLMQQLKKGTLNSFDLETAKSKISHKIDYYI